MKGLTMCYSVILVTFYSAAVSGYWTFGNKSNSNILKSLMPDDGPSLAPTWVLGLGVIFVLLQLFAIGLVSLVHIYPFKHTVSSSTSVRIKRLSLAKHNFTATHFRDAGC